MRVLVIGFGAIGDWLAGVLSRGGAEVSVLARGATLAALRSNGLTLLHGEKRETFRVSASDRAADLAQPDAVVLAVKTNGFADAVGSAADVVRHGPLLVTVMNGLPGVSCPVSRDRSTTAAAMLTQLTGRRSSWPVKVPLVSRH